MNLQDIQNQILKAMLLKVAQVGWSWETVENVALELGYAPGMALLVFPGGLHEILEKINHYFDGQMVEAYQDKGDDSLRTHEKVKLALRVRLQAMSPYYASLVKISQFYVHPIRFPLLMKCLWKTVDEIWYLAKDMSLDYTYYTKRGILYAIHSSTLIFWMKQDSNDLQAVFDFLDRRLKGTAKIPHIKSQIQALFSFMRKSS